MIDNFKFCPGQLRTGGGQWQVISLNPLRRDDNSLRQCQEIANPEISDRNRNVNLDRQPVDQRIHPRVPFTLRAPGRFNQGHFSRNLGKYGAPGARLRTWVELNRHMPRTGALE